MDGMGIFLDLARDQTTKSGGVDEIMAGAGLPIGSNHGRSLSRPHFSGAEFRSPGAPGIVHSTAITGLSGESTQLPLKKCIGPTAEDSKPPITWQVRRRSRALLR